MFRRYCSEHAVELVPGAREGRTAIMACRSSRLILPQAAISSRLRRQPMHRRVPGSIVQTLVHGLSTLGVVGRLVNAGPRHRQGGRESLAG